MHAEPRQYKHHCWGKKKKRKEKNPAAKIIDFIELTQMCHKKVNSLKLGNSTEAGKQQQVERRLRPYLWLLPTHAAPTRLPAVARARPRPAGRLRGGAVVRSVERRRRALQTGAPQRRRRRRRRSWRLRRLSGECPGCAPGSSSSCLRRLALAAPLAGVLQVPRTPSGDEQALRVPTLHALSSLRS